MEEQVQRPYRIGDRVIARLDDGREEMGTFVYQRMAGPDYVKPEAISVKLDSRRHLHGYTGTMFTADEVRLA